MNRTISTLGALALSGAWLIGGVGASLAADLPKSTQKMLDDLKLTGTKMVKGLAQEVASSAPFVAAATKEGKVEMNGSWRDKDFIKMVRPFKERYPGIVIDYHRGTTHDRNIKPLLAYKAGRVTTDVITGVGVNLSGFLKANALMDLSSIPNLKNVPETMRDKGGLWVGQRLRYWCMAYNTKKIKVSELPKTWDDVLTAKHLHKGRMGMANRPNNFMIMLWGKQGAAKGTHYIEQLFRTVKPQLRKEGTNATIALVVAGEFDVTFPAAAYRTAQYAAKGAPVSWHCPTPVPLSFSGMIALNKNPHPNAVKLFINWYLSKEGQIAQYYADNAPPIHKDLQDSQFLIYPKQVIGKPVALRSRVLMEKEMPKVVKIWDKQWLGASGLKLVTVKSKITKLARAGRRVSFKVGGKTHTVKVSGTRTKLSVGGKPVSRRKIKVGMECSILYPGDKQEAKEIACR